MLKVLGGLLRARAEWRKVLERKKDERYLGPPDKGALPRARRDRTFPVDLTYTTSIDVPDGKGGILYPKGYIFNPLDYVIYPKTLVVNDPASVRNAPEKLFVTHFDNVMPPTLITADARALRAFRDEHKDIILKPLFGNGGAGVFRVRPDDENFASLLEMFSQRSREPLIAQRYLPEVRKGDKRIILIDGKPVGAIDRVPAEGEARSNMHVGGRPEKTELTARERDICAAIGPELKRRGLIFTGIDVIGDYMTEINVTSPTGIHEVRRFGGADIAALVWDAIEHRRKAAR